MKSGIFFGYVSHQRFGDIRHSFSYPMAMMMLDLDQLPALGRVSRLFGVKAFRPLSFNPADYLKSQDSANLRCDEAVAALKQRVLDKAAALGAKGEFDKVLFAGQIRHFGFYFSPVNFFFLGEGGQLRYLLAEVSNTPWNERHCYLVDLEAVREQGQVSNDKVFHVSPFMTLDMKYRWQVEASDERLKLVIANQQGAEQLFRASLNLRGEAFDKAGLKRLMKQFPLLTLYILYGIYRQALSLYRKGVTFVAHPGPVER
ncbi:DUF1365 family protein [Shewanella sp. JM162201]|uniref:DUF1365 family protein n=1 Tax=Shewanella jiangmenensis TaxID=2837387 RepID=A0ABS5V421_9GAMM|nr:DUF1365 domain-containing protein [Shewanella jiangmenensis]MBT1444439.1 DUF1365 family protein [Shewanella jiangmenensis]